MRRKGKLLIGNYLMLRKIILQRLHASTDGAHSEKNATIRRVKTMIYWERLNKDIKHFIQQAYKLELIMNSKIHNVCIPCIKEKKKCSSLHKLPYEEGRRGWRSNWSGIKSSLYESFMIWIKYIPFSLSRVLSTLLFLCNCF